MAKKEEKPARIDRVEDLADGTVLYDSDWEPARIDSVEELTDEPEEPVTPPTPEPSKPTYTPPPAYESNYQTQIDTLLDSIMNSGPFEFNINADPLYQQYKDQYVQGGRMAMMDTMGQASALSGGYGNSYASTAGNQAYQNYLQGLNDRALDIYDRAYGAYQDDRGWMLNQMGVLGDLDDRAYGRYTDNRDFGYGMYRDSMGDYYNDYALAYQMERDEVADNQWAIEHWKQIRNAQKQANKKKKKKNNSSSNSTGGSYVDESWLNRL